MAATRTPVVFDTDIGGNVDDALALALALASPEIDLLAVSVVHGDERMLDLRARIAARLLGLAGRGDVPVLRGVGTPFPGGRACRPTGSEGHGLLEHPPPPGCTDALVDDTPAVEWLSQAARLHAGLHLVATGPFTTVATALSHDPALAARLQRLTVMGGMFHPEHLPPYWRRAVARGEVVPAELDYNSRCDPRAAEICAASGVPPAYVPIEVTLHTQLTTASLRRLQAASSPFLQALARLVAVWSERHFLHRDHGQPNAVANLHDALAMASLLPQHADWLRFEALPPQHRVATAVDAARFERFYLDRVLAAFG
jgi:purine nucleosidase